MLGEVPIGFPPIDYPLDNEFSLARWQLGKKLFYDPILSVDSSISCANCHKSEFAFADDLSLSPGVFDRPGTRNAPSLVNVAYQPFFLREGTLPSLEMQILVPIQEHNEFAHNIVDIAEKLQLIPEYVQLSESAYSRLPDAFVITRAISTFERSLISFNSPYDKWKYGDCEDALSPSAKRGFELFFGEKARCSSCHGGLNFSDYSFQNNGLYEVYTDIGRMRFSGDSADLAKFKVPSLRNAALTAPYMHDGSLQTLESVIEHYDSGGEPHPSKSRFVKKLSLSDGEKGDLLNFLRSLSDPSIANNPAFLP